ncbi:MAG: 4'-phosphopantetheinyl transferase superfamily protein [Gammaproteobacteria bacterium]|nr:4'-phosphopantetheinyl transferase superfamily protein [Gammaproteobacteria bacterium]
MQRYETIQKYLILPPILIFSDPTLNTHPYSLSPSHIDVWRIALEPSCPFEHQLNWLNAEELERFRRFYFPQHRRRFAQARLAVKTILARYLNCLPSTLYFQYQTYGKPEFAHTSQIKFNISHSQDVALLAVGQQQTLGIDIEQFSCRPFLGIAAHFFSPTEQAYLQHSPPALLALRFFSIWSRKEALIKANGFGINYPTQSIDLLKTGPFHDPLHDQSWSMLTFFPQPAFAASLCYHPSIETIQHHVYDPSTA